MSLADPRKTFRSLVADQLLTSLRKSIADQDPSKSGNTVLVVDEQALSVLNAALPQSEVLKAGFMTVAPFENEEEESSTLRRRRYPQLDVVYFMRHTAANLKLILRDYAQDVFADEPDIFERCFPCIFRGISALDIEPPWYADVRILTIPHVDPTRGLSSAPKLENELLGMINSSVDSRRRYARLLDAWKRDASKLECPVDVMAYEPSLFSLDENDTLSICYNHRLYTEGRARAQRASDKHLDGVAFRVMTALVTLNEMPYIRYAASEDRRVAEQVALSLTKALATYRAMHPGFTPWGTVRDDDMGGPGGRALRSGEPPEPATVIVVDRVDDLAPALLHDTTYSCLVTDLLKHTPCMPFLHTYKKKTGERVEKEVLLDESDPVWRSLRYEDMQAVTDIVDEGLQTGIQRERARAELDRENVSDLRALMAAVASDENLVVSKFTQHYRMKNDIFEAFAARNMHPVVTLEQILVTGCDELGGKVKTADIKTRMTELMADTRLTSADKARLLILFILCHKELDEATRKELVRKAALKPTHEAAILNLPHIGVPIVRRSNDQRAEGAPFHDDHTLKRNRTQAPTIQRLCRYVTKLEDIVRLHVSENLQEDQYPWTSRPPAKDPRVANAIAADPTSFLSGSAVGRGTHGDVTNRFAVESLAASTTGAAAAVPVNRGKKSRFAGGAEGKGGDATPAPGGRAAEDPWAKYMEPPRPRTYTGGRIIVVVVGGITQAEIAAMERLSRETNREIIVGGTTLLTPAAFLKHLASVEEENDDIEEAAASAAVAAAGGAAGREYDSDEER